MRQIALAVFVFTGLFLAAPAACVEAEYYKSSYVGDGYPAAFNDWGDVVIHRHFDYMTGDFYEPVLIADGIITELNDPNWERVGATAINNSGVVVGWVKVGGIKNPAIWQDDHWEMIIETVWGSEPLAINDDGVVVGRNWYYAPGYGATYLTLMAGVLGLTSDGTVLIEAAGHMYHLTEETFGEWYNGVEFGELPSEAVVLATNKAGQILIEYDDDGYKIGLWDDGDVAELEAIGSSSYGHSLNDAGEVVALATNGMDSWPVRWTPDGMGGMSAAWVYAPGASLTANRTPKINNEGWILAAGNIHPATYILFDPTTTEPDGYGFTLVENDLVIAFPETGPQCPMFTVELERDGAGPDIDWDTAMVWIDGWFAPSAVSGNVLYCTFDHELPWGWHTFEVTILDEAGNQATLYFGFSIGETDTTPPSISEKVPQGTIATATPVISVLASDAESWVDWSSCYATIDGNPAEITTDTGYGPSGRIYFSVPWELTDDEHTVSIINLLDNAMNDIASPVTWTFTVDTGNVSVASMAPTGYVTTSSVTLSATVTKSGGVNWNDIEMFVDYEEAAYTYDGGGNVTFVAAGLADGVHNVMLAGETWEFTVDATPPTLFIFSAQNGTIFPVNDPDFFVFYEDSTSGIDVSTLKFYDTTGLEKELEGSGDFAAFRHNSLVDGQYSVSCSVRNNAGLLSVCNLEFTINTSFLVLITARYGALPITWSAVAMLNGEEVSDQCDFSWSGGPAEQMNSQFHVTSEFPADDYEITVTATFGMLTANCAAGIIVGPAPNPIYGGEPPPPQPPPAPPTEPTPPTKVEFIVKEDKKIAGQLDREGDRCIGLLVYRKAVGGNSEQRGKIGMLERVSKARVPTGKQTAGHLADKLLWTGKSDSKPNWSSFLHPDGHRLMLDYVTSKLNQYNEYTDGSIAFDQVQSHYLQTPSVKSEKDIKYLETLNSGYEIEMILKATDNQHAKFTVIKRPRKCSVTSEGKVFSSDAGPTPEIKVEIKFKNNGTAQNPDWGLDE